MKNSDSKMVNEKGFYRSPEEIELNKQILDNLIIFKKLRNKNELASFLGISAQRLWAWYQNGNRDIQIILNRFQNINPVFVSTGRYYFLSGTVTLLPEQFFVDKSLVFRIVGTYFLLVFLSFFIIFVCFIVRQGSTIHCNIDITHLIQRKIKCYIEVLYEA